MRVFQGAAILAVAFGPMLFMLFVGHAVCDYPLQGDFLAKGKNRFNPLPGVPWYWCLGAHAFIHAGAVFLITGSLVLALMELVAHWVIDDVKCAGNIGFDVDQSLHIGCKVVWLLIGSYSGLLWHIEFSGG